MNGEERGAPLTADAAVAVARNLSLVALLAHGIAPADLPPLQEAFEDRLRQAVTELGPESAATVLGSIFLTSSPRLKPGDSR